MILIVFSAAYAVHKYIAIPIDKFRQGRLHKNALISKQRKLGKLN